MAKCGCCWYREAQKGSAVCQTCYDALYKIYIDAYKRAEDGKANGQES